MTGTASATTIRKMCFLTAMSSATTNIYLLYSTFGSAQEALSVARKLVEEKLVACANIHSGVTSVYSWEGKVEEAPETVLIAKTTAEKLESAIDAVKRLHSYELPCIIACPIEAGHPPFLQWVHASVTG